MLVFFFRFSALSKPDDDSSRRYGGSSPARGEGRGRGGFGRPPGINARHSQEAEREKAVAAAKYVVLFIDTCTGEESFFNESLGFLRFCF